MTEQLVNIAETVLKSLQLGGNLVPNDKTTQKRNEMTELISSFLDVDLDNSDEILGLLNDLKEFFV